MSQKKLYTEYGTVELHRRERAEVRFHGRKPTKSEMNLKKHSHH